MSLVATNLLGQNSPVIEALQAEYAEMWAQDAAAMYNYAASSEAASTLLPFTSPTPTSDPAGPAAQAAAVAAGAGSAAGTDVQTALGLMSSINAQTLQGLAALVSPASSALPAASITVPTPIGELDVAATYIAVTATISLSLSAVNTARPWIFGYGNSAANDQGNNAEQSTQGTPLRSESGAGPTTGGGASAGVGQAALVGALTVPHSWTVAAPEIRLAVESLPSASVGPVPTNLGGAPAALLGGMALASLAGRGMTGSSGQATTNPAATDEDGQPKRKPTVVVIQQPPAGPGPTGDRPR